MIYDTLKLSKALRTSFTPEQSDTLAQAFSESTEDSVATKLDIAGLRGDMADLRTELKVEIAALRTDVADLRAELKTEIAAVRTEFKTEISSVRTELKTEIASVRTEIAALRVELKTEIANLKVDMVRWIVGAIAFNLLGTIGIMIAVAQLVLRAR